MITNLEARTHAGALLAARRSSRSRWDAVAREVAAVTGLNSSALRREVDRVTALPARQTLRAGGDTTVLASGLYLAAQGL